MSDVIVADAPAVAQPTPKPRTRPKAAQRPKPAKAKAKKAGAKNGNARKVSGKGKAKGVGGGSFHFRTPPRNGTVLKRTFKGKEYVVKVKADGFEYKGKVLPSLTAAARAITGYPKINGYLFFNLD